MDRQFTVRFLYVLVLSDCATEEKITATEGGTSGSSAESVGSSEDACIRHDVPVTSELSCSPQGDYEFVLCIPRDGQPCGACCDDCVHSPQAKTIVDGVFGEYACVEWEMDTLCGPSEEGPNCCYVVQLGISCLGGDS
jgi:hypothetical protein